jgi:pullulanase
VQSAGALDALYAEAATKLAYGAVVEGGNVTFRLWAPTAKSVKLALFDEQHKALGERAMTQDEASGSWSVQGAAIWSANTIATTSRSITRSAASWNPIR